MKKSVMTKFAGGVLLALILLCIASTGVLAEDESAEVNPIKSIVLDKDTIWAEEPIVCTVNFDESILHKYIGLQVHFRIEGTENHFSFTMENDFVENLSFSYTIGTTNFVTGIYAVDEVNYKLDPDDEYTSFTPEGVSIQVKGGAEYPVFIEPSIKLSSNEVLQGDSFAFTVAIEDIYQIDEPTLIVRRTNPDKSKKVENITAADSVRSGKVQTFTWTIPTKDVENGTNFILVAVEATNSKKRTASLSLGAFYSVRVVEKLTPEEPPKEEDSDKEEEGSENPEPENSGSESNGTPSSSGKTPGPEQSNTPVTMKAAIFSAETACLPGTDALESELYLTTKFSPKNNDPLLGTEFYRLKARQSKVKKNSITIKWSAVSVPVKAAKYVVYGSECGKRFKKLKETTKTSYTQKKLKKGKYYKYLVMAVDPSGRIISASPSVIVATKGGKYGNCSSLKLKSKSSVFLHTGRSAAIKVKEKKPSSMKVYRSLCYECTNPDVLSVSGTGVITALTKGTGEVYVFTQNGLYKRIKVTVQ